jgi:hypothetical protein
MQTRFSVTTGQDVKLLTCPLWVFWCPTDNPAQAEDKMIEAFKNRVASCLSQIGCARPKSRSSLRRSHVAAEKQALRRKGFPKFCFGKAECSVEDQCFKCSH